MTNPREDLFSASVFMGGNQRMEMLIDTATDFVAVNGIDCAQCKQSSIYDIESNYVNGIATLAFNKNVTEYYGTARFDGVHATDQLCFTLGKCFTLDFLYVSSQNSLDGQFSAVLGFARPGKNFLYGVDQPQDADKMVLSKIASLGEEKYFSTRISRNVISWIDIGTPDSS